MSLTKRKFFILFFLISVFSILVPNQLYAQSTKTYTLYATSVNNAWRWVLQERALGASNGMEAIQPFYDDKQYSAPLIATGFDSWILPAGEVITNVKIGAYIYFSKASHTITMTSPLVEKGWNLGSIQNITWKKIRIQHETVKLRLFQDGVIVLNPEIKSKGSKSLSKDYINLINVYREGLS